jgi:DNA-directed RNA polymerase beta' subunit
MTHVYDIDSIQFGLMSEEDVKRLSVACITSPRTLQQDPLGTVYDPRMGPMGASEVCLTCSQLSNQCPGHFGHIELNVPILHPLFYKQILGFLKCICFQCSRMLITEDLVGLWNLVRLQKDQRFLAIIDRLEKSRFCVHCNMTQPLYTFSIQEGVFYATYKVNGEVSRLPVTVDEMAVLFQEFRDEDVRLLGLDPELSHPKRLILTVLPVLPPRARPYSISDHNISDDDLTIQYIEILKANQQLASPTVSESKRTKAIQSLCFRIKTLMDNSQGKAKHTNARQIKGIKERLAGKDGLIRNNLMGKRVDQSGRTVIGPDPTLRIDEIALPHEMADVLTFPETVTVMNRDSLQRLINREQASVLIRRGVRINLKYGRTHRSETKSLRDTSGNPMTIRYKWHSSGMYIIQTELGDIIERCLQNGDMVLINRQPTLHGGSMMAHRVIRRPGKTMRLNLAVCKSFNADFDGDEMNVYPPQSQLTRTELECLSSTPNWIMEASNSKPNIVLVQDTILSVYLMTKEWISIPSPTFQQCTMKCDGWTPHTLHTRLNHIRHVYQTHGINQEVYNGRALFSMLLPTDFHYDKPFSDGNRVLIDQGVLLSGRITKGAIGSAHASIVTYLYHEYGSSTTIEFLNNIQFLAGEFMLFHGFSIGLEDCLATETQAIQHVVAKSFVEADHIERTTRNEFIRETKLNMALSRAKDVGMRMAKDALKHDNNFVDTVQSGSKGDFFNIAQIMGLLGQQNITGKRVEPQLNHGQRTLSHYPFKIHDKAQEYESRGFIRQSFIEGLSPQAFWFHAMSGREGITDTAMKTAQSGYIQRKMVKIMEDIQVKYDRTVRNSVGSIIQFAYGEDHLSGAHTLIHHDEPILCDVERLAHRLNTQYEQTHSMGTSP